MDKEAELLGVKDNDDSPVESSPPVPYRIICNSEHFIVINPSRKPKKKAEGEQQEQKGKEAAPRKKILQS